MKKLLMLSVLVLGLYSCSDDDLLPADNLTGDKIAGFQRPSVSASYFEDEGPITIQVPVYLVGLGNGQLSNSDIELSYAIDEANSTAVAGQEYTLAPTGQVTIPAGSDFALIPVVVNTGSLNESVATRLVLTLTSLTEGVIIGEQYRRTTVNFVGCLADLAGSWTVSILRESSGTVTTLPTEMIHELDINEFKTTNTGTFTAGQAPDQGMRFSVLCGIIEVPDQGLFMGQYSNQVEGVGLSTGDFAGEHGYVSADGNTMVIRYRADSNGAGAWINWTNTYTRN